MNEFLPILIMGITFYYIYYLLFWQGSAPVGGIHNCKNKSITAMYFISTTATYFISTIANFYIGIVQTNSKTANAENVPCFFKSRNTSNLIFRSNYYLFHLYFLLHSLPPPRLFWLDVLEWKICNLEGK